jgi:predicted metal-dependent hydrolase
MTHDEYLLICISEECAEIQKVISKILRFGLEHQLEGKEHTNHTLLLNEIHDLLATIEFTQELNIIRTPEIEDSFKAIDEKKSKISKYFEYSKNLGIINKEEQ